MSVHTRTITGASLESMQVDLKDVLHFVSKIINQQRKHSANYYHTLAAHVILSKPALSHPHRAHTGWLGHTNTHAVFVTGAPLFHQTQTQIH